MLKLHVRRGILPLYLKVLRQETQDWAQETINTMASPLTFFLAFGLGLRQYITDVDGMTYMTFLVPGLISMTILMEAYRTGAWGMWLDRWHQGMLDEYRIKPITTSDIIIGEILGGFTVALIKGFIVALILLLMTPVDFRWEYVAMYLPLLFAGSILFTCVGTMVGTYFTKPDQIAQTQTIFITPLLYLGGLFFPIHAFPENVVPWVRWLPTTALFDGGRSVMLHGQVDQQYVLVLVVTAAAAFVGATYFFNRKLSE